MGFRLHLKWSGISVQSPLSTSSSSWPSSYSNRGRDYSYLLAKSSVASLIYGETEIPADTSKHHARSSSRQTFENYYLRAGDTKMALGKDSDDGLYNLLDNNTTITSKEDDSEYLTSLQATDSSQFQLLMKNVDQLESMFVGSDMVSLENDILKQLERLGALSLFNSSLSKTVKTSDLCTAPPMISEEVDDLMDKVLIKSGKKELRKMKRKKSLENRKSILELPSQSISKGRPSKIKPSRSRKKRQKFARSEAEMSSGVKLIAELEKIKIVLEEGTGQAASLGSWAAAAGIEKKTLQERLHYGWRCRDELLISTRSLVLFVGKNYWGAGVPFDDLIQAGNIGVLRGAEKFDQSRGYKFSTYVQYWIRKSMSTLVTKHARGIRIPCTLSTVINQIYKARQALSSGHGKNPDDIEIAKYSGLSVAKIESASKCLRVVASIDRNIGGFINVKYSDVIPDLSVKSPEEYVARQHMMNDMYSLLNNLDRREQQVLVMRYGLRKCQCRSLEEIGKVLGVSKEWVRKIEKTAMAKLRNEESLEALNSYVHTQY